MDASKLGQTTEKLKKLIFEKQEKFFFASDRFFVDWTTRGRCYNTFYGGNLLPFHGNTVIQCYKVILPR
jgi:hypothetical protein